MGVTLGFGGSVVAWALCLFTPVGPRQSPQPLSRTALPLTLIGVIVDAAESSNSVCLIRCAYPLERAHAFGPGQNACDVAEVQEVRGDAIVIRNLLTNVSELLPLQEAMPPATAVEFADAKAPVQAASATPPPMVRKSSDVVTIEVPEASVRHYLANLPELLGSARATPHYRSTGFGQSSVDGFEIDQIKLGGVVEQMGLVNGDVVIELNGEPLDSVASVMRLFARAQGMTQSRMTILRNGQRLMFVLNRR
jgi:type II secretory pathway component PulC